jgi:hypothetical protein
VYVCDGEASEEVCPSPKLQAYDVIVPSGSELPVPLKATVKAAVPLVGFAVITAVGGVFVLVTVSLAEVLVSEPTELLTTTLKVDPLSAIVVAGVT